MNVGLALHVVMLHFVTQYMLCLAGDIMLEIVSRRFMCQLFFEGGSDQQSHV